jgi:hypothetical protein
MQDFQTTNGPVRSRDLDSCNDRSYTGGSYRGCRGDTTARRADRGDPPADPRGCLRITGDASTDARDDGASVATTDYGDMLDTLDAAIEEAQPKVESGRVYDAENGKVRIK